MPPDRGLQFDQGGRDRLRLLVNPSPPTMAHYTLSSNIRAPGRGRLGDPCVSTRENDGVRRMCVCAYVLGLLYAFGAHWRA